MSYHEKRQATPIMRILSMRRSLTALCLITCLTALSGCGLAFNSAIDSMDYDSPIPGYDASHEEIMAAARVNPKDALISYSFYKVATPEEVREILAANSMDASRQLHANPQNDSHAIGLGTLLFEMVFIPTMELNLEWHYPLREALRATPHAEVLTILLDAGATAPAWHIYFTDSKYTPETLEILLTRCPLGYERYNTHLLHILIRHSDDPALVKVFLTKGPKMDLNKPHYATGDTPLSAAVRKENLTVARLLMEYGANREQIYGWNERVLGLALATGQYAFAKELIDSGADCTYLAGDYWSLLYNVIPDYPYRINPEKKPDWTMSAYLAARVRVDGETGQRAVEAACFTCSLPALKILLERGAVLRPGTTYVLGPWQPEQKAMGEFLAARGIAFKLSNEYPVPDY